MTDGTTKKRLLVSFLTLRRIVGVLGFTLPFVLVIGCLSCSDCGGIKDSISAYYHTGMQDILVGVIFAIGSFLFAYKGYERRDDVAGYLAGIFAVGVALFPTAKHCEIPTAINTLHSISAGGLFLILAYFSIFLFPKTGCGGRLFALPAVCSVKVVKGKRVTREKLRRNRIYVICGAIILGCLLVICVYKFWLEESCSSSRWTLWLESLLLMAFGFSWFIKGETLWKDDDCKTLDHQSAKRGSASGSRPTIP